MNNTIDKFGRRKQKAKLLQIRGQTGIGFKLTRDGNYDIQRKKLRNVGDPVDAKDSATCEYVDKRFRNFEMAFKDYGTRDIKTLRKEITDTQKSLVLLYKYILDVEYRLQFNQRAKTSGGKSVIKGAESPKPLSLLNELREKGITFFEEYLE